MNSHPAKGLSSGRGSAETSRQVASEPERDLRNQAERDVLETRLARRGEELDRTALLLAAAEDAIDTLETTIATLRSQDCESRAERTALRNQIAELTLHNEGLSQSLAQREHEVAMANRALREWLQDGEEELAQTTARIRSLESELEARDTEAEAARIRIADLERAQRPATEEVPQIASTGPVLQLGSAPAPTAGGSASAQDDGDAD